MDITYIDVNIDKPVTVSINVNINMLVVVYCLVNLKIYSKLS